jgi:AcrR family transcriptional regulator
MMQAPLTAERILKAAQEVLRGYGPDKANVVDVAHELDVSHASVYRHFPSKAALRDAVAERWLAEVSAPLARVAAAQDPAPDRLRTWLHQLVLSKQPSQCRAAASNHCGRLASGAIGPRLRRCRGGNPPVAPCCAKTAPPRLRHRPEPYAGFPRMSGPAVGP